MCGQVVGEAVAGGDHLGDGLDAKEAAKFAQSAARQWRQHYQAMLQSAEDIRMALPWSPAPPQWDLETLLSDSARRWLARQPGVSDELPLLRLSDSEHSSPGQSAVSCETHSVTDRVLH